MKLAKIKYPTKDWRLYWAWFLKAFGHHLKLIKGRWGIFMEQADPAPFLTPRQAAKLLNLPTHRVRIMIRRKELPALKVGRHWRIPKSEVIKLVRSE